MAAMTDVLETQLLNHVLRNIAFDSPTDVYVGLFSTQTNDDGSGTEITAAGRQPVTFSEPVNGACSNVGDLNWTGMPAGNVINIAIFDAPTGGVMLLHGGLSESKDVGEGDTLTIYDGNLVISLN